jgi:tetratricopeptide (TPR) repeat protein
MLLGGDFFLSHRVLVAHSQRRVYFSYNGGPVFRLDQGGARIAAAAPPPPAAPSADAPAAPLDAAALVRRAKASAVRGEYASAIDDLSRAIALEPSEAQHFVERAAVRVRAGQAVLAMADLDQALKLQPDFTEALLLRGELRLAAHDLSGANDDFAAATRSAPNKPLVSAAVAGLYANAGQFERAVARYDEAITADPRESELLNARCWARALWGRELDKALADCDAAIRIGPRRAAYFDSRGLVHLRRGEFDLAIADYDAALKMQPKKAWSLFGRSLAKAKKGDAAGSAADMSAAEALAPDIRAQAKHYGVTEETVVALQAPRS